jgi:DNA-binding MarR family transcriptional regulator
MVYNPIDLLHGEPGALVDLDDLSQLFESICAIDPWTERHAEVLDYVFSCRVARALDRRAGSDELRELHEHIRRAAALVRSEDHLEEAWAARWRGYAAILDARIGAIATQDSGAVLSRAHVQKVLDLLRKAGPAGLAQAELLDKLDVGKANLTRVLGLMEDHDLIERRKVGRDKQVFLGPSAPPPKPAPAEPSESKANRGLSLLSKHAHAA